MSNKINFKQFLEKPEPYHVIEVKWKHWSDELDLTFHDVLREQGTGWYYHSGGFFAFENARDCELVKGVLSWRALEKAI
jgi:hypothetical protein